MAMWKLQDPRNFSPEFIAAIGFGPGTHVISTVHTKAAAKALQTRWNLFRFCCRGYPSSEWEVKETAFERSTYVTYNHDISRWQLCVRVRETGMSILRNMKVVAKSIDS